MFARRDIEALYPWLPNAAPATLDDLPPELRFYSDGKMDIWYSPHGEPTASPRLCILGITPGWQQVKIAYTAAAAAIRDGATRAVAATMPKPQVPFAGSMRKNLNKMLNDLGLPVLLGHDSADTLYGSEALRTGSVLKFPVFVRGTNYSGHGPSPLSHPALREMIETVLFRELDEMGPVPVLPLGKAAEAVLEHAVDARQLDRERLLTGLPHPSGANGHRWRHFAEHGPRLREQLEDWFSPNV